jgi:hypothetical protein
MRVLVCTAHTTYNQAKIQKKTHTRAHNRRALKCKHTCVRHIITHHPELHRIQNAQSHKRIANENINECSSHLPGVARRTLMPLRNRAFSLCFFSPPMTAPGTIQMYGRNSLANTSRLCTTSSRVGRRITAYGPRGRVRCEQKVDGEKCAGDTRDFFSFFTCGQKSKEYMHCTRKWATEVLRCAPKPACTRDVHVC